MSDIEEEWEVEYVRDRRERDGKVEYFVKWLYWPERENTWEPVENLQNCLAEVKKFEQRREYSELLNAVTGFDLGLKIKKVTGVRQLNETELPDAPLSDRIFYFVEWEDSGRVDLVASKIVREKAPQFIIDYFRSIIRWAPPPSSFVDAQAEGQREATAEANSSRQSQAVGSVAAEAGTEVAGMPATAGAPQGSALRLQRRRRRQSFRRTLQRAPRTLSEGRSSSDKENEYGSISFMSE